VNLKRIAVGALALSFLAGSCAGGGDASAGPTASQSVVDDAVPETTEAAPRPTTSVSSAGSDTRLSPLAELVESAGSLKLDPDDGTSVPQPVAVSMNSIGVDEAGVREVGVATNGEMEIPGADEIGWYRWSPSPGHAGSAVLAAHIAYNGSDGVFRYLDDVEIGEVVSVDYDDGTVRDFEIIEKSQYRKDKLPFDRIFAKDGEPILTLITCGGTFNQSLRSYDDNIVAYAVPI
jgi:LPXTG-site transpeptidase (sortase) family protein